MKYYLQHYTTVEGRVHTYNKSLIPERKRLPRPEVTPRMLEVSRSIGVINAAEMFGVSVYDIDRARKLVSKE